MATEGIYGGISFGHARGRIHTFQGINRKYSGRFGAHMVHLRKPLLEWAGSDLVEIQYEISLDAAWCGDPLPLLSSWHRYHESAQAAPLLVGNKPMGPGLSLFVIENLSEQHKHWLPKGKLLSVDLSVSFKEYIPFTESSFAPLGLPGFGGGL